MTREAIRHRAVAIVARAIKRGVLPTLHGGQTPCSDCGQPATMYDHRDYRKPLKVAPVCRGCNGRRGYGLTGINDQYELTKHRYRVPRFTCLKCGTTWASRTDGIPRRCGNPHCRKTTWNQAPRRKGAA